ncbi:MAG: hypothetical protein M3405_16560 [Acidobacteriota bacterium]|jgi:uncharacterized C2H2 Zn-finger protein|nr:hypothetical protein [Acidobacteriota bacterium]
MDEEIENNDDSVSLSVSTSADRDLFTRRTCPKCGLDFKISASENDIAWLLNEQIKRQGIEGKISSEDDLKEEKNNFCCPYCEEIFDSTESFTEETINYAKRIIYREIVLPMLDKTFGGLSDSINNNNRSSGGFMSISISFEHNRQPKPPRPFHEPEPADMKIVHFLCCDRKAKIMENWVSIKVCIYCQTEIAII